MQSKRSAVRREAWAAGTMIVLGLGAIAQASTYTLGSLARMGRACSRRSWASCWSCWA